MTLWDMRGEWLGGLAAGVSMTTDRPAELPSGIPDAPFQQYPSLVLNAAIPIQPPL